MTVTPLPAPKPAARFWRASELHGVPVPSREWLVDGLVPSRTVTLLSGDGGTGKSLLALQLAASVSSGGLWLGRQVSTGGAVFLSAEDDEDELHRRLADIGTASDLDLLDLDQLTLSSLAGEDALLAALDPSGKLSPSPLFRELEAQLVAIEPALLVLDTAADLFPGNENDRAQVRHFIGLLRGLAIRHDCAVVLLSHPSVAGMASGTGLSGSTAWNNSVRSRLYFSRVAQDGYEADPDARILRTMKANYGATGGEVAVRWDCGVFVPVGAETCLDKAATTAKAERVFLALLREMAAQGRPVNASAGPNYAPAIFSGHPGAEGCTRRALKTAMEKLLTSGAITNVESGPPSKRRSRLVEANQ